MDQEELKILQEQFGELNMLNFTKESTASLMGETGFQSVKLKLHSYLSPDHLKRK